MKRMGLQIAVMLSVVSWALAAVPTQMNYQGRLLDGGGNPVSSNVIISVAVFGQASGGAALYGEGIGTVPVQNGLYSFSFGTNAAGIASALTNASCWLELVVNGETLAPRQRLLASPYAVRAAHADAYSESDPVWSGASGQYYTKAESAGLFATGTPLYVESDPQWSAVSNAVQTGAGHGDAAFAWGNHATNGYATTGYVDGVTGALQSSVSGEIGASVAGLSNALDVVAFAGETDPVWSGASGQYYTKAESDGLFATGTPLYVESDPRALLTSGVRPMSGAIRMGGFGLTNVAVDGITFADGGTLGQKYVDVAGDTMTGALALPAGGLVVGNTQLVVLANGYIGIGTANPTNALAVNGTIKAKEIVVTLDGWSDYVFADGYALRPLSEVESYVQHNGHLPGIPSAADVQLHGVDVGRMHARLLEKIEELTLYVIQLQKENEALRERIDHLDANGAGPAHP
ncbi:MAG: hypothetical protein K8T26_00840 [Lentisphaerae bacterium]|nr:hypothetical protein [Lentisphaerota bacterium]